MTDSVVGVVNSSGETGRSPIQFVLCGVKNTGKTVYLSTLFGAVHSISTANQETTRLLKHEWSKISTGHWPEATALGMRELSFLYRNHGYEAEFEINDYDGRLSEILSSDDDDCGQDLDALRNHIRSASGLIFFFPFHDTSVEADQERFERFRDEINTFIQLVKEAVPSGSGIGVPVVIAVTKWDMSPDFGAVDEDNKAEQFLQKIPAYRAAVGQIKAFFKTVQVIPIGVLEPGNKKDKDFVISPYNCTLPIDFILKYEFSRIERLAEEYAEDEQNLFFHLDDHYQELFFFAEGRYLKQRDSLEASLLKGHLAQLERIGSPARQRAYIEENQVFFDRLRRDENTRQLHTLLRQTEKKHRTLLVGGGITIILAIALAVTGLMAQNLREAEYQAYNEALAVEKMNSDELARIERVMIGNKTVERTVCSRPEGYLSRFNQDDNGMQRLLLAGVDVSEHYKQIKQAMSAMQQKVGVSFEKVFEAAQKPDLDVQERMTLLDQAQQLLVCVPGNTWGDALEVVRQEAELMRALEVQYESYKANQDTMSESWSDLKSSLSPLRGRFDRADELYVASLKAHEVALDRERWKKLTEELSETIDAAEFRQRMEDELAHLTSDGNGISALKISDRAEQLERIRQRSFSRFEEAEVQSLRTSCEIFSDDGVRALQRTLKSFDNRMVEVPGISGQFQRSSEVKVMLNACRENLRVAQMALSRGVKVNKVVFRSTAASYDSPLNPVGFYCEANATGLEKAQGLIGNDADRDKINLTFGRVVLNYLDSSLCPSQSPERHWSNVPNLFLKSGPLEFQVSGANANNRISTDTIALSPEDILKLSNTHQLSVSIKNTGYKIDFYR